MYCGLLMFDWMDCEDQFVLAKSILVEDYEKATEYMDRVPLTIWDCGYQDWPLCSSFVKSDVFKQKYEIVYGHRYAKRTTKGKLSEDEVIQIISEHKKNKVLQ